MGQLLGEGPVEVAETGPGDGGAYDALAVPGVLVEVIDDDAADVIIIESDGDTMVVEDAEGGDDWRCDEMVERRMHDHGDQKPRREFLQTRLATAFHHRR